VSGWTLFLIVLGAAYATSMFFRLIDAIERPR
jgi:hypothetical protein